MSDDTFAAADFEPAPNAETSSAATAEPTAPVDTPAQPEAPPTQAADATAVSPSTEPAKTGPIPFDVHKTALENARTKAVEEWKQKYGWAEQVDPRELQQLQHIGRHFASGDFVTGLQSLIAEARKDPSVDAALRSLHARELAALRGQRPDAEPDFLVQQPDGSVMFDPNAFAQWKDWNAKQLLGQFEQKVSPLKQTIEQWEKQQHELQQQQAVAQFVEATHRDVLTWPGMDNEANRRKVGERLATMRVDESDPRAVMLALNQAYRTEVLPTLQTHERRQVLNTIHQQANASTVNPAHASTRAPKSMDEMSIEEALQHVASQSA